MESKTLYHFKFAVNADDFSFSPSTWQKICIKYLTHRKHAAALPCETRNQRILINGSIMPKKCYAGVNMSRLKLGSLGFVVGRR